MFSRKSLALFLTCALTTWLPASSLHAAPAQVPMFLGGAVEPNIMFTLDDSTSMVLEMMPDSLNSASTVFPPASPLYGTTLIFGSLFYPAVSFGQTNNIYDKWVRSSAFNRIYYDPRIRYRPWANADGTLMANATPSCAPNNPVQTTSPACRDLTANNSQTWKWLVYNGSYTTSFTATATCGTNFFCTSSETFWPAFYYNYTGGSSDADKGDAANFTRVEIRSTTPSYTGGPNRSDCSAKPTCSYTEEIQNFANWYTYYRSRILLARAGVGRAFSEQGTDLRVGFAAINQGAATVDGVSSPGAVIRGVRDFAGSDRTAFFNSLYTHTIQSGAFTPLRRALDDVGQYFTRSDSDGPWSESPGSGSTTAQLTCRQSYNILMTDGYWNNAAAPTNTGTVNATNADNNDGPTITGPDGQSFQYTPANPYQGLSDATDDDDNSILIQQNDTLADVAMYYWNRDLRTDLENRVPTSPEDPAFWQHLVNFTVGLGVTGTLNPDPVSGDLPALKAGTKRWPMPSVSGAEENIDDLWHAAVNSRGGFFSAANPDEFAERLSDTLSQITGRIGSSASIATNSTRLDADTFIYQARFDSNGWVGNLLGYKIDQTTGDVIDANTGTPDVVDPFWEAGSLLDSRSSARDIFTHEAADSDGDGSPGVDFLWNDDFPTAFKALLNTGPSGADSLGELRLQFLHGDRTQELPSGPFRQRDSRLSDIVNSDPAFVGQQDYGYNLLPGSEGSSYVSYRASSAYKNRPGVVYVGANDGMLHAFHGETGNELFAYIPENLLPNLWQLTDPNYSHRFFVDAAPNGRDAYLDSSWRSVLVGATGAGGMSVFALDVTDPLNFDKTDVLWEFSSSNDADLGYTIGQPSVVRLPNGAWAAVFGNGYDSTNRHAVLFIVNLETGALIKKIDTGVGDASTPNGLATPVVVDTNEDRIGDRVYAGDLLGNLWAFDISDNSNLTKWEVDYKSGSTLLPLFTALDEDGNSQPITAKPQTGKHPKGGVMVYFGTGKYFEPGDGTNNGKNSFYGLWDDFSANSPAPIPSGFRTSGSTTLLQQVITHETYDDASDNSWLGNSDGDLTNDTENPFNDDLRVTTDTAIDWSTNYGWFIDLKSPLPSRGWEGERSVSAPLLLEGRVVFTTLIPTGDPCKTGGESWLMELSALDGARLVVTPFDLNADTLFNESDYVEIWLTDEYGVQTEKIKIPVSGKRSKVGIIKTPAVIKTKEKEFKFTSGSSGEIERTLESRSYREGRQSWRQLR
ncbi:MAG: pilus assembly protein PilY [Gammaproteobacteria bacterium]|nr:pilus assembly protein PilY [Gammaproteobacteria bacterium]MCP5417859.1 pilus assembly protein PilY [Chromatiaceae bacterium]